MARLVYIRLSGLPLDGLLAIASHMRHLPHRSLCATVAVSAALALGSTQVSAQDAVPTIEMPAPAPAAPAPTIVLPPTVTAPAVEEPAAAPSPPAARAERPAPRSTVRA